MSDAEQIAEVKTPARRVERAALEAKIRWPSVRQIILHHCNVKVAGESSDCFR